MMIIKSKNVHTFIGCESEYENCTAVLFGAPYDGTASYRPGSRFAPAAVRNESFGIETYSPYSDRDLTDLAVFDGGDLELPFGGPARVVEMVENYTQKLLRGGKLPFMVGGEHTVTLGAVRAACQKHPDLRVIHLDAHADLRDEYIGERLSHSAVMRRVHDLLGDGRIYQFGIRSGDRGEFDFANGGHVHMQKFNFNGLEQTVSELNGKPVYLTVDLDVLDPSELPGTGTPEAGGVTFCELLAAVNAVSRLNIVGADAVELCPPCDPSGISTALTCKIIREMLLLFGGK